MIKKFYGRVNPDTQRSEATTWEDLTAEERRPYEQDNARARALGGYLEGQDLSSMNGATDATNQFLGMCKELGIAFEGAQR